MNRHCVICEKFKLQTADTSSKIKLDQIFASGEKVAEI